MFEKYGLLQFLIFSNLFSACNCNPAGAIRVPGQPLGGCGPGAAMTDKLCECKERVMGNICDTCKPGYWDLDTNNALGCRGMWNAWLV